MAKNNSEENPLDIKIILLGETGTGKTNLINTYYGKDFDPNTQTTTECQFDIKKLEINNRICAVNIWDTIGQEQYRAITKSFIRGTDIVILVYDITRRDTFLELNYWFDIASLELGKDVIFGVVGNKNDLYLSSDVTSEEGENFAQQKDAIFSLASAKTDPESFKDLVEKLLEKYLKHKNIIKKEENIIILNEDEAKKKVTKKKKFC